MATFGPPVLIPSVIAYYFGMLIGYSSGEFIVYNVGMTTANLNLILTNRRKRVSICSYVKQIAKGGIQLVSDISHIMSEYRQNIKDNVPDNPKETKNIFILLKRKTVSVLPSVTYKAIRMAIIYLIVTIVVIVVSVLIATQALSYADLSQPLVAAPLLMIFSYGIGKYIGEAAAKLKMLPKYYKLEKRRFLYEMKKDNN